MPRITAEANGPEPHQGLLTLSEIELTGPRINHGKPRMHGPHGEIQGCCRWREKQAACPGGRRTGLRPTPRADGRPYVPGRAPNRYLTPTVSDQWSISLIALVLTSSGIGWVR